MDNRKLSFKAVVGSYNYNLATPKTESRHGYSTRSSRPC